MSIVWTFLQELAADAGRNLDHALPSMDAAMHAIQSLSPGELAELRNMKNPSDLVQQVSITKKNYDRSLQRWLEETDKSWVAFTLAMCRCKNAGDCGRN